MDLKRKKLIILTISIAICIIGVGSIFIINYVRASNVAEVVTVEAGSQMPDAGIFYSGRAKNVTYATDISTIPLNVPGMYDIKINVDGRVYKSKVNVVDTTAPKGVVKTVDLYEGETVTPEAFFESIIDTTEVTVSFKEEPDFNKINSQTVKLVLTDTSGNMSEYEATLRISKLKEVVQVEAGQESLDLDIFLKPNVNAREITLVSGPDSLDKVGKYPVFINIDGKIYESAVEVTDTIPPQGVAEPVTAWVGDAVEPEKFIKEINDATSVTVRYKEEPDFNMEGEQEVSLVLTDEGGNETVLQTRLTTVKDTEPPEIYGDDKATAFIGVPFSYKKLVYAEDNRDGEVPVSVDASQVNLKVEGEYTAIFTATDSSGNTATKEVTISVRQPSVTMEELEKLADEVLARITTEDMTLREKAWAIWKYVNTHIAYTGSSDKSDWMKEAYKGIVKGYGDCFTYYSVSQLLLNRIGAQTLSVERLTKPGEARHYWHMVNLGDGWYHFDATPQIRRFVAFMVTDEELEAYSRTYKDSYYYRYDKSKYPATPEK
ncbi:transglutaminase domain-containing protein [Thermoclostridium stercorarium]|nr:transglutaminase domain-containing protein [Thermoclostridium stercorarium]